MHIDHSTLKYLLEKKDANYRLIQGILLLPEFDLDIVDKARSENAVDYHLSRLIVESWVIPYNDVVPNGHLLAISLGKVLLFATIVNYLTFGILPPNLTSHQKKHS